MSIVRKSIFAAALAASALASATPALADGYRRHNGDGDDAAIAIGAGVIGLALGAIIASSDDNDRRRDRYYSDGYGYDYGNNPGYSMNWQYRDGWYWDRDGGRHSRHEYDRYRRHGDHRRGYDRDGDDRRRGY
jgi:hypothetical protein